MTAAPGADELRVRGILQRRGVGPDAKPPAAAPRSVNRPGHTQAPVQPPPADSPAPASGNRWWWETRPRRTSPDDSPGDAPDGDPVDETAELSVEPEDPAEEPPPQKGSHRMKLPWRRGQDQQQDQDEQGQPQTHEISPGIHVVIQPVQPAAPAETPAQQRDRHRREQIRRWLLIHGAAAGTGWAFGLYAAMAELLNTAGHGGVGAGLGMALISYVAAEFVMSSRYLRIVPPGLRPLAAWTLRIPFATALLATALYAPHTLIGAST